MKSILFCVVTLMSLTIATLPLRAQTCALNKAAVLKAYQELNAKHSAANWEGKLQPTVPGGYIPYWLKGSGNINEGFNQYFASIPDGKFKVEGLSCAASVVTFDLICTGTFRSKFMDWEPTGKPFSYRCTLSLTFDNNGKVTDGWPFPDPALYLH